MASNEYKARALYDFVAETAAELSFTENEILILTSTPAENLWWTARNSFGQTGSIPSNYVEIIYDEQESTQQTATYQDINFNYDSIDDANIYHQPTSEATYQPQIEQEQIQNTDLTSINNWTTDPDSQIYQEPFTNDQQINIDNTFNPLLSTTRNDNTSDFIPVTSLSSDPYITVTDIPVVQNSILQTSDNSFQPNMKTSYQTDPWYFDSTNVSTPILSTDSSIQHDSTLSYGYPQITITDARQEQQISSLDDFMYSSQMSNSDAIYDNIPTQVINSNPPVTMMPSTIHNISSIPIENNSNLNNFPTTQPLSETKSEEVAKSAPPIKETKNKFFTLKRQKSKREGEKRLSLSDASLDSSLKRMNDDNNSLSSNVSGSALQHTISNPNKSPVGEGDAKGSAPRAR
ncbi:unnamed protein product [Rotaria sp. Silwood1]|nr:unnamed protein product [Rotaria sp. Silwood1]